MKKILLWLLLLCQLVFSPLTALAEPQIPPRPTTSIYVQDRAGVLSASTRNTINAYGSALQQKTKAQIVVLTVPALGDATPEEYGLAVLRGWGIGDKNLNNGVLLLVAVNDRKSRIEVGYGLEGALPDGLTGRIQDQYMLPYFKNGNYDKGILNAYGALLQTVLKEYNLSVEDLGVQRSAQAAAAQNPGSSDTAWNPLNILLLAGVLLLIIVDQLLFGGAILRFLLYLFFFRGGGRGGGFGGGGFGGGSYGGGSGGGGGSSRSW